jgi:hypothetical protein
MHTVLYQERYNVQCSVLGKVSSIRLGFRSELATRLLTKHACCTTHYRSSYKQHTDTDTHDDCIQTRGLSTSRKCIPTPTSFYVTKAYQRQLLSTRRRPLLDLETIPIFRLRFCSLDRLLLSATAPVPS